MVRSMDFGQVFILNAANLEKLEHCGCYECHQRVDIGDVVVRQKVLNSHGARTIVFHAFCFGKVLRRRHAE